MYNIRKFAGHSLSVQPLETLSKIIPNFSILDETFNRDRVGSCHLSMQVGMENICCAVLDAERNRYVALESYNLPGIYNHSMLCERLEGLIIQSPLLSAFSGKKNVNAAFVTSRSALVPKALYDDTKKETYLGFSHAPETGETILKDELSGADAVNLYGVPGLLENLLKKNYPGLSVRHFSTPLLESLVRKYRNNPGRMVFTHVQLSHFEIIVLQGKQLQFYNSFQYQTSEDFIYYLLFVFEQMKLNPEKDTLHLAGEVDRSSAMFDMAYKYIRDIKFMERPESFEYSYAFNEIPPQYFYNLFNQYLCV